MNDKMKRYQQMIVAALLVLGGLLTGCKSAQDVARVADKTMDSSGFVNITDVVPDVILEIRYFSTYNFVGARIDGYEEPVALMTREAADSLRAVSDDLKRHGYCIKIYDAYRPQRGVDHFMRWALDLADTVTKAYFYPRLTKKEVFDGEYVATKSGHSRGSTVDLTIVDKKTGKEVDMGGTFDWFGIESHPDYGGGNPETLDFNQTDPNFTSEQFYNRMVLRTAMLRHGFKPLDNEWWHFTLKNEPYPDTYFNFPVRTLTK